MSCGDNSSDVHKEVEFQGQSSNFSSGQNIGEPSTLKNLKGKENAVDSEDQETMELYSRARAQEKEIMYLKEQIALASIKESQMLNEKYALERKFSELRMALDEKQNEVITSASNELARRKGDLEVNLNLLNELKAVEDEKHIFTSSMIGILAEYGALPHVTNASAITHSIKHLHDELQLKIRTSHARLADIHSMIGNNSRNIFRDKEISNLSPMNSQFPTSSTSMHGFSQYSNYIDPKHLGPTDDVSRYVQDNNASLVKSLSQNNEGIQRTLPNVDRNVAGHIVENTLERSAFLSEQMTADHFSHPPITSERGGSFGSEEEVPGIDSFQIIGDAKPGMKLLGCGYPVRGTSLCMFQWVRHNPDGTRQSIEGATNPEYVVTADDVDKLIAVECIPMDEHGRQGDIVRIFANDQNKITCDEEMQEEIDTYISKGLAIFSVFILLDSSENWEPATLFLRRSGFQVKVERKQDAVISEKYTKDLLIKIPSGLSAQFVLTFPNGSSYPFSTSNDIRMRDAVVLTMRIFQKRAFNEKRKAKA